MVAASLQDHAEACHVNLFPSTVLAQPIDDLVDVVGGASIRITVELSERLFVGDTSAIKAGVARLKDAGARIAIEDVGCGRSSLEALIMLQPDVIKIDRQYVTGSGRDVVKESGLRRLATIAHALGTEVIAEGIESREDLAAVANVGIDLGQGYLWGRPG